MQKVHFEKVNSQEELDAINTDGVVCFAKVTSEFSFHSLDDIIVFSHNTNNWETLFSNPEGAIDNGEG